LALFPDELTHNFLSGIDSLSLFRKTKYRVGNIFRTLTAPWLEDSIDPNLAISIFGYSFGDNGWHHLKETLNEYDENPNRDVKDTTMWKFLKNFCPTSISTIAGISFEDPLPLFVYPWSKSDTSNKDPLKSRFCGPSTDSFVQDEYMRTISLYREMKITGYMPHKYPYSIISGTFLISSNGQKRFIVMQGNHRMAILSHLAKGNVLVRANFRQIPFVYEKKIETWPNVKTGRCSIDHARKVFYYFFKNNKLDIKKISE
jgi:hypothetical protein